MKKFAFLLMISLIITVLWSCGGRTKQLEGELDSMNSKYASLEKQLEAKDEELQSKNEELRSKSLEITRLIEDLQSCEARMMSLDEQLIMLQLRPSTNTTVSDNSNNLFSILFWSDGKAYRTTNTLYSDCFCSKPIQEDTVFISKMIYHLDLKNGNSVYVGMSSTYQLVWSPTSIKLKEDSDCTIKAEIPSDIDVSDFLSIVFWSTDKTYTTNTKLYSDCFCSQQISSDTIFTSNVKLKVKLSNDNIVYLAKNQDGLVWSPNNINLK